MEGSLGGGVSHKKKSMEYSSKLLKEVSRLVISAGSAPLKGGLVSDSDI